MSENSESNLWKVIAGMGTVIMFMAGMWVQDIRDKTEFQKAEERFLQFHLQSEQHFLELHESTQNIIRDFERTTNEVLKNAAVLDTRVTTLEKHH